MYIIQITRINFKNRPDDQTVTYAKRVPEWLSQWTARNNYAPLLCLDLEEGLREQQANVIDQFWADMNSAVPELCKRTKAEHMADFSFDYTIHNGAPGLKTVYHGCGNFEYSPLPHCNDVKSVHDKSDKKTVRRRLINVVAKAFPDGNLVEQFINHGYTLKTLCDEAGQEDVDDLFAALAAEFDVGASCMIYMDLDHLIMYIEDYHKAPV